MNCAGRQAGRNSAAKDGLRFQRLPVEYLNCRLQIEDFRLRTVIIVYSAATLRGIFNLKSRISNLNFQIYSTFHPLTSTAACAVPNSFAR